MLLIEFLSTCCFYGTKLLKEGTRKYETHSEFIIVDPVPWLGLVDSCEQHRRNISSLNIFHEHHRIRPIWTLLLLLFFLVQFGIIRLMFNLNFAKECHVCSFISCETLLGRGGTIKVRPILIKLEKLLPISTKTHDNNCTAENVIIDLLSLETFSRARSSFE